MKFSSVCFSFSDISKCKYGHRQFRIFQKVRWNRQ